MANPVGALWSAAEMVRWLGRGDFDALADDLMLAIEIVLDKGIKTKDMSGDASTAEMGAAVCEQLVHNTERSV